MTAFVQSWWVTSHICPILGQPNGYMLATAIATTGSNQAVGILMGYGYVRSHLPLFCPVTSNGSLVLCRVRLKQASYLLHFWWEGNLMGLWKVALILLLFDFGCPTRPRNSKIPLVHPLGTWHGHFRFGPIFACVESNI